MTSVQLSGLGVGVAIAAWGAVAPSALAQVDNFTYELRLLAGPSTGPLESICWTGGRVTYWLEARARANTLAPGHQNYGVLRATTGPAGQSQAFISVSDSVAGTRLARSEVVSAGPGGFALTGRMPLFRAGGPVDDATPSPWHSATENGSGGLPFPSGSGNQFGALDQNGDRIHGFDAFAGAARNGATNPWVSDFPVTPVGQFSPWSRLYQFDVIVAPGWERSIFLNASAYLSAGVLTRDIGQGSWPMRLTASSPASGSASASGIVNCWPSPSAAALLGLGSCVASRRKRP